MELLTVSWFLVFLVQQSSLYTSIILAPFSLMLMLSLSTSLLLSSFLLYIFVMVFIGGLIVLLVSVASLSTQDQGVMTSLPPFLVLVALLLPPETVPLYSSDYISSIMWVTDLVSVCFILILLIAALFVITNLVFNFKGLVRSVCL